MFYKLKSYFYNRNHTFRAFCIACYDLCRIFKHSGAFQQCKTEQRRAQLTMAYHIIEKGLTMPNIRLGFGEAAVLTLIDLCNNFEIHESKDDSIFIHCIEVLKAYKELHEANNYQLNDKLSSALLDITSRHIDAKADHQLSISKEDFFSHSNSSFLEFSNSRHTCRHFKGTIPKETISKAVQLANNAPSACNRQHTRVHCVSDSLVKEKLLSIQGGNRGFGHAADKLLIITTDLHDIRWLEERNDVYTNAGLFTMNLCYALHYYKIACCILNWSVSPFVDQQIRHIVSIPESENIVCIIACGDCPEEVKIASSPRKPLNDILTFCK